MLSKNFVPALLIIACIVQVKQSDSSSKSANVLIIGDSLGAFSDNLLATHCKSSRVVNAAQSGSTAAQWTKPVIVKHAFSQIRSPTHVWLSVGGNDFFNAGCAASAATTVRKRVKASIEAVIDAGPRFGMKILMTGYAAAFASECETWNTAQQIAKLKTLNGAIQAAAAGFSQVTYVGIATPLGLTDSSMAKPKYFLKDGIHPNSAGYKVIFTIHQIQKFLQCGYTGKKVKKARRSSKSRGKKVAARRKPGARRKIPRPKPAARRASRKPRPKPNSKTQSSKSKARRPNPRPRPAAKKWHRI